MARNEAQQVRCRAHPTSIHQFITPFSPKKKEKKKKTANHQRKTKLRRASPESETARRFRLNKPQGNKTGGGGAEMGSPLGGWPSYNPHNFSQLVPADPSAQPSVGQHFPSLAISSLIYSN